MPAHPLSFSEVLEDEYRYFHEELPYEQIELEAKHVREIEDFASLLEQKRTAHERSRWTVLAAHLADPKPDQDHATVVLAALNRLLTEETLLAQLLADPLFARGFGQRPVCRALVRIPIARRLLLETAGIGTELAARQEIIDLFAGSSAAIRVLVANGWRSTFGAHPGLLSTIADDEVIDAALAGKGELREALGKIYGFIAPRRPSRLSFLSGRVAPASTAAPLPTDPRFVRRSLGLTVEPPPHDATPPEQLSHFNALLVEDAYSDYVCSGQTIRALYAAVNREETAALCLSGGGIRSATFNLGVLQGLADHRMLNRFHYISTVSGGGYIGSWLSSWMRRHSEGAVGVAKDLSREPNDPLAPEVEPIHHLREYSSYLAPRATAFSLDSWTLLATYIRNLLLNWTMLVPLFAAMLTVPRLFERYIKRALSPWDASWSGPIALIAALLAVLIIAVVRPASELPVEKSKLWMRKSGLAPWLIFLIVSAFSFCLYWAEHADSAVESGWLIPLLFAGGSVIGAAVYGGRVWKDAAIDIPSGLKRLGLEVLCAGVSGVIAGWLLLEAFGRLFPLSVLNDPTALHGLSVEIYVCAAVPLYLLILFAHSALLIGLSTEFTKDYDREWWARSAAAVILFCVLHACAAFAVLLLPVLILELPQLTAPIGGLSGLGSWLLSRRPKKSGSGSAAGRLLMPMLRLAATITLLFLVALISIGTSSLLDSIHGWKVPAAVERYATSYGGAERLDDIRSLFVPRPPPGNDLDASTRYLYVLRETRLTTLWVFLAAGFAIALLMARLLNVNIYSMHGMYRNRLIRAYLGASRWERRPDPFTGFDPQDNIEMWKLRPHCLWQSSFVDFHPFAVKLAGMSWWKEPKLSKENDKTSEAVEGAREEIEEYLAPDGDLAELELRLMKERDELEKKAAQERKNFDANVREQRAQLGSMHEEARREIESKIEKERQEFNSGAKKELRDFDVKATEELKEIETEARQTRENLEPETMVAVIDALNALMRCYDLAHDVEAPPTLARVVENREYLDAVFHPALKAFKPKSRIDENPRSLSIPDDPKNGIPGELKREKPRKLLHAPLLRVPPLHIVNASLNLVDGDNLAWQERKAASFTISPLHAGSRTLHAYRDAAEYGEAISLGTAMAISGAAVSPNMGALSSPAFTFLMTIFNARLGWWIGNPKSDKTSNVPSPRWSLLSLLREALGKTDDEHPYVFLSDGGHFENLGLYEMVLRRCKYIIVCDASADGSYGFGDLANAVRKIRIDLGIPIEPLVTKYIGPQEDERYGRYCAVGEIHYKNVDGGNAMGYLVYIKPAIYSDSPADVRNYAKESTSFPHETTADQFFSESQFESYRALGRYVIGKICNDEIGSTPCVAPNVPYFFANAWNYVNGAEPPVGDQRIRKVSDVVKWMKSGLGDE